MKIKDKVRYRSVSLMISFLLFALPIYALPAIAISPIKPIQKYIDIHVKYKQARQNDTLSLIIENVFYGDAGIEHNNWGTCRAVAKNGVFNFHVPVRQNGGYFTIITQRVTTKRGWATNIMPLINTCFWEAGDNISIVLSHKETAAGTYSKCSFTGLGSAKYTIAQLTDSIFNATVVTNPKPMFDSLFNFSDFFPEKYGPAIRKIKENKFLLSDFAYQVLKANIIYSSGNGRFNLLTEYYDKNIKNGDLKSKERFRKKVNEAFFKSTPMHFAETALLNSENYIVYTYYKFKALSYINSDKDDQKLVYNLMKQKLTGAIRDKEWVYLLRNYFMSSSLPELYADAEKNITDPLSRQTLDLLLKAAPGKPFYNFNLQDINGKNVSLTDFRGKSVVVDFWFVGCGGCAQFFQNVLKQAEQDYKGDSSVVFVSINSDMSRQRWIGGVKDGIYTSAHAINLYTNGLGASHPLIVANNITTFPFAVLVDGKGIIRFLNSANLFNYTEFKTALKSTQ